VRFKIRFLGRPFCFLLAVVFAQNILAQSLQQRADKIRTFVDSSNLNAALDELRSLKTADASAFTLNNYDYLLARLLEGTGDQVGSFSGYQAVVARRSLLSQYALWHLARLARSSGDLVLERERLRQLIITAPTSLLRDAVTIRLAESFFESADYTGTVSTLRPLTEAKNPTLARQALVLSGDAYNRAGKPNEVREVFNKVIVNMPDASRPDDFALAAVRGLDGLDKQDPTRLPSEADHLQRAEVYQFNRDFEAARPHYLAVVETFAESANLPDALYQIGRGLYQEGQYDEALKYLRRVTTAYNSGSSGRDALALIAACYNRTKRIDEAVATYKQFIERYPAAPNPERAYLNIIDALRDGGRDQEALSWAKQTRERFKDQLGGTLALFAQARIHVAQNSWNAAVSDLDELLRASDLGGARVPGGTNRSELLYLRALANEQLERTQDAVDDYLLIPEGRNEYYGFRANERLRTLVADPRSSYNRLRADLIGGEPARLLEKGEVEAARRAAQNQLRLIAEPAKRNELLAIARRAYASLPAYKFPSFQLLSLSRTVANTSAPKDEVAPTHQLLADELLYLGLYDEGAAELVAARLDNSGAKTEAEKGATQNAGGSDGDAAYTLAVYFLRGGMSYPAVRFAEQTWRSIPGDYLLELAPRQLTEMLYPAPYRSAVLKYALPRQVDPRFVLSIARQETRFQADAKSVAAARGLMQFIAATATETAKQLGRQDLRQDELYNPDTAIEFGSQYLSSLFRQFPNQPQAVATAYNGGADNIARWIARSRSLEPDRYVPEIGFAQSKDYVFRVMSNYWVYQGLYDAALQPQQ
jgi:soluble lytic murein transglycosylase-like protein/tetratricopeptide (TPR) repeat protein